MLKSLPRIILASLETSLLFDKEKYIKQGINKNSMSEEEHRLIAQRKQKLALLRKQGINPYPSSFHKKDYAKDILEKFKKLKKEEKTKNKVSIGGRIMTLRVMGKAGFAHLQDFTGKIQIYAREDQLGKEDYKLFSKLDLGDIIGVEGVVFRTQKGEVSVWVKKLVLLAKNLRPLPEKWHGLKDIEARYRQRYLDLIVNPEVMEIFLKRSKIIDAMREFLVNNGFVNVETPILQPIYGGTNARPFKSFLQNLKMDVYMRISNELYLKRLIVGGYEKVFEFSYDFRNEGIDTTHNPEFLQMETMWAYADYKDNMKFTEDMFFYICKKALGKTNFNFQDKKIDLKKPWKKMSMIAALKEYANINAESLGVNGIIELLNKHKIKFDKSITWGIGVALLFEELVESKLVQPTIIYDYPVETSPLAKINSRDPRFVERFEVYLNGWEIANSYSELNDPEVLLNNWKEQENKAKSGDEEAQRMDKDFLTALEIGMPPTSGLGVGIDRLTMLLTNSQSIKDVIFFPFMKQ